MGTLGGFEVVVVGGGVIEILVVEGGFVVVGDLFVVGIVIVGVVWVELLDVVGCSPSPPTQVVAPVVQVCPGPQASVRKISM